MKLLLKLTILIITAGCVTTNQPLTFDEKVQEYAEEFYKDFPYAEEVVIKAARTISMRLHGRCIPDVPVAIVNPYSTGNFTDGQIQYLVYHELGHCALDLPHSGRATIMDGSPFPKKFTIKAVVDLRQLHKDVCGGVVTSVRKLAFGPKAPMHISCFIRRSMEDTD